MLLDRFRELLLRLRELSLGGLSVFEWALVGLLAAWVVQVLLCLYRHINPPRSEEKDPHPINDVVPKKVDLPRGKEHLLLVDDEPIALKANAVQLEGLGYEVDQALSGEEAVEFVRENPVDLIVLDMRMPGMDGAETFRKIRDIRPDQHAIMLTGWAQPSKVQAMTSLGVRHYLIKPVPSLTLARAIRDELEVDTASKPPDGSSPVPPSPEPATALSA
jgi:CheY-like chemotaxis protein